MNKGDGGVVVVGAAGPMESIDEHGNGFDDNSTIDEHSQDNKEEEGGEGGSGGGEGGRGGIESIQQESLSGGGGDEYFPVEGSDFMDTSPGGLDAEESVAGGRVDDALNGDSSLHEDDAGAAEEVSDDDGRAAMDMIEDEAGGEESRVRSAVAWEDEVSANQSSSMNHDDGDQPQEVTITSGSSHDSGSSRTKHLMSVSSKLSATLKSKRLRPHASSTSVTSSNRSTTSKKSVATPASRMKVKVVSASSSIASTSILKKMHSRGGDQAVRNRVITSTSTDHSFVSYPSYSSGGGDDSIAASDLHHRSVSGAKAEMLQSLLSCSPSSRFHSGNQSSASHSTSSMNSRSHALPPINTTSTTTSSHNNNSHTPSHHSHKHRSAVERARCFVDLAPYGVTEEVNVIMFHHDITMLNTHLLGMLYL